MVLMSTQSPTSTAFTIAEHFTANLAGWVLACVVCGLYCVCVYVRVWCECALRVSLRAKQKSAAQFRWEPTARRCVASRLGGVSKDPGATCVWRVGHLCREMRVCAMSMSPGLASARPRRARHARGSGGSYTRDTTPSPTTPEAGEGEGQTAASLKCAQDPDSNWKSCWKCACV